VISPTARYLALLLLSLSAGCDDKGGGGDIGTSSCELGASVSGVVTWENPTAPACAITFGGTTDITMGFLFIDGEVESITIDVAEIGEGETGMFPATFEIRHSDDRRWIADQCTVQIDAHVADPEFDDELSRSYLVHGTGSCSGAAVTQGGTMDGPQVEPFEFRFPPRWPK
jgi:hypothetical protein